MEAKNYEKIPAEKFNFVKNHDRFHDQKLQTKARGYFADAFSRFCKNRGSVVGAIIIIILILFAIIVPFCTQYSVAYTDTYYRTTLPKAKLFANTNFWDGCEARADGKRDFIYYYAMGLETGHNAVKNQEYTVDEDGFYHYRLDSYQKIGMKYVQLTESEYKALQDYQDKYEIQVIYPTVRKANRPQFPPNASDANYYYKTTGTGRTDIVYDENGNIIPVYDYYVEGNAADKYTSKMRIEGADGFLGEEGNVCYYSYAIVGPTVEVRVNYYEYYIYQHTQVLKDGITEPYFIFGTTGNGQDILTCLASGARFSFIFAIIVAVVNMFVGAIYGAVEGYYGGKADLFMERISDILAAVPIMIVITLLKLHMGGSSQILVLFLAFFMTGWIGMASTTRMQFYRYKNQEYVLAARTLGAKDRRIIWKHIFPNALGTLVTSCALVIPSMIFSETNLSFLGIINLSSGNITSVGTLISQGQAALSTAPYIALIPSVFLVLLMLSFNLFGNGLRDAFNPSLRGTEG